MLVYLKIFSEFYQPEKKFGHQAHIGFWVGCKYSLPSKFQKQMIALMRINLGNSVYKKKVLYETIASLNKHIHTSYLKHIIYLKWQLNINKNKIF